MTAEELSKVGRDFRRDRPPKRDKDTQSASHQGVLEEFLLSCRAEGRTVQALRGLRTRVPKLFAYVDEMGLELLSLKARDAQSYIGWLSSNHTERSGSLYSGHTVAAFFTAATTFYEYLRRRGLVLTNPFKECKRIRSEKHIPRGLLKESQMEELLQELSRFDEEGHLKAAITGYKVHVAAELMYAAGLRVSEVAALRVSDLDLARGTLAVREGKGGYQRVAFLNEFASEVLRLYVERVRTLALSQWNLRNTDRLFAMGWEQFGKMMNGELARACASLGFPPMRSHGFRHAVGYHLLRAGCNIRHIQSILGHRRLRNTEVYTKVEKEDLKNVVDACHPRKWKPTEYERAG